MSFRILVYDFIELLAVDRAALVDIDGVEALLVTLLIPGHVWVSCLHELLAEVAALYNVQIAVSIVVSLREDVEDDGTQLLTRDLGLPDRIFLALHGAPLVRAISYAAGPGLLTIHLHLLPLQATTLRRKRAGHCHRIAHRLLAAVARLLSLLGRSE